MTVGWRYLVVAAAVTTVYANSLSGPLVFDDRDTIIDNHTIEDLGDSRVLSPPHETSVAGRPVANVSFALNYALGERRVLGYHLFNIAVHGLCAILLLAIARRAGLPDAAAVAVALLWAVHPLNSEAVDYLTQRTESLMALFYLSTVYCAIRAAGQRASRRLWSVAAIASCALGMATKESMVTAPVAVMLFDRVFLFPSAREALRRRGWLYAGLAATWGLLVALIWSGPRGSSAGFMAHDADARVYLLNQAVMIVHYLRLALVPRGLVLYYGWPAPLTVAGVLPQLAVVAALLALTGWALWRRPQLGFLGAWFFLTLAPTSSIVPIATEVGAERRMYLPLIAVVALAVIVFRRLVRSPPVRAVALVATTALLGAGTIARNVEYRSSLRLAETAVERWPTPAAHGMFGTELAAAGRLAEAERHLREAQAGHPPARYYLATVLVAENRPAEAIDYFHSFIASQPPELEQVRLAHAGLAGALLETGREREAETEDRLILERDPSDIPAMTQLAQLLLKGGRFGEAIPILRQLTIAQPMDPWAFGALGVALASTGVLDEAVDAFRRQVDLDPGNDHARQNLARAVSMRGR